MENLPFIFKGLGSFEWKEEKSIVGFLWSDFFEPHPSSPYALDLLPPASPPSTCPAAMMYIFETANCILHDVHQDPCRTTLIWFQEAFLIIFYEPKVCFPKIEFFFVFLKKKHFLFFFFLPLCFQLSCEMMVRVGRDGTWRVFLAMIRNSFQSVTMVLETSRGLFLFGYGMPRIPPQPHHNINHCH